MGKHSPRHAPLLSVFSLIMITVGSVDSVRNLPATALFGSQLIFYFALGALFFLLPCALVSAELASCPHRQGGIYVWVKQAFGDQWGFVAIWLQWIENVIWYPTILSFVAGTLGYLISPALAESKPFLVSVILVSFWGATLVNLKGMHSSARFSSFCAIAGLLVPMTLIIGLGAVWLCGEHPIQIALTAQAMIPSAQGSTSWVALTGIMMSFCGIEIATVHAAEVHHPQRDFPLALLISVIIIISTLVLGSLAIAIVLPTQSISLVAGIMQTFDVFFTAYHLNFLLPILAVMLVIGALGGVSNWIIAPTRGLLIAARDGHLPRFLQYTNENHAPSALLILQALIVSALCLVFLFEETVNQSYWLLTALAASLYMLMYMLMFAAAVVLRLREGQRSAVFQIPGGLLGLVVVAGMGFMGCATTVAVSFIPPDSLGMRIPHAYEVSMAIGLLCMCLPPWILYYFTPEKHRKRRMQSHS